MLLLLQMYFLNRRRVCIQKVVGLRSELPTLKIVFPLWLSSFLRAIKPLRSIGKCLIPGFLKLSNLFKIAHQINERLDEFLSQGIFIDQPQVKI